MTATRKRKLPSTEDITSYLSHLKQEERAPATLEKYERDIRAFYNYLGDSTLTKDAVTSWRDTLRATHEDSSINSMLSALNGFFTFSGAQDLKAKHLKTQRKLFRKETEELTEEEYRRLVSTARLQGDETLSLIIQTICMTGIRVSELTGITVEAVYKGETSVVSKGGKRRQLFIVPDLQKVLVRYASKHSIRSGPLFTNKQGKPFSRFYIWRKMKGLCKQARIAPSKVFPHNLRHLFARVFYAASKDLAKLADILGHESIDTTRIYIAETGCTHKKMIGLLGLHCAD